MKDELSWLTRKYDGRRELDLPRRIDISLEEFAEPLTNISVRATQPETDTETPMSATDIKHRSEFPHHFYEAQRQLEAYRIKGEIQTEIARRFTADQIRNIYTRLEHILGHHSASFVRHAPWFFLYGNGQLQLYLSALSKTFQELHNQFSDKLPKEYDWRRTPQAFRDVDALNQIQRDTNALKSVPPNALDELHDKRLRDSLIPYQGKKIIFIGVRTPYQESTIREFMPKSAKLDFHSGENLKGLVGQYLDHDIVVIGAGAATHKIDDRLRAEIRQDYYLRRVKVNAVNPMRILSALTENSYRFK